MHDVVRDSRGRLYVGDRTNQRVQIFDGSGKFLGKWTNIGAPWGLDYVARLLGAQVGARARFKSDGRRWPSSPPRTALTQSPSAS